MTSRSNKKTEKKDGLSRREFLGGIAATGIVGATGIIGQRGFIFGMPASPATSTTTHVRSSTPTSVSSTSTSTTTTSTTSTTGHIARGDFDKILAAHNIHTKTVIAYGDPFSSGLGSFGNLQNAVNYYGGMGFKIYPYQDGSSGYTSGGAMDATCTAFNAAGGGVIAPLYGWGYTTGWAFNAAARFPDEQEYYLVNGALVKATSYGKNGVTIDAPPYSDLWASLYQSIDQGIGLQNLLGISGWPGSDHGVNYGGAQGVNGGHNMRSYDRYVNSPFYLRDVINGSHNRDSTPCLLWGLRGVSPNLFTGQVTVTAKGNGSSSTYSGGVIPTAALAQDVSVYHHASQTSSFALYMATANAMIELRLLNLILAKNPAAFARTAIPLNILAGIPAYFNSQLVLMAPGLNSAFGLMQNSGAAIAAMPYFNYANPLDNSSNPGQSGSVGVASPSTVGNFWTNWVPYLSHYDFIDVDTATGSMQTQASLTRWPHFAALWSQIPADGWYGYLQDKIRVLYLGHNYGDANSLSALGLVCHQWGNDSYASLSGYLSMFGVNLSQFNAILGIPKNQDPSYSSDIQLLTNYVNAGGTLILQSNSGGPASLTGTGTTATPIQYGHPITQPYAKADLDAVYPSGYGTINKVGAGHVVVLHSTYYGEGFSLGDSTNGQGGSDSLSSGLAWLTQNAILWAAGQQTPAAYLPKIVKRTAWANPNMGVNNQGQYSGVGIHILGRNSGKKIILISNSNSTALPVAFNLSAAFYGFASSYSMRELNTGQTIRGSGDIVINTHVPAQDWLVYVSQ